MEETFMKLLCITKCPTGMVQTYVAAEQLESAAEAMVMKSGQRHTAHRESVENLLRSRLMRLIM